MTNYTIFATKTQSAQTAPDAMCIICGEERPASSMVTGPHKADGGFAFMCGHHLRYSQQFISLLADYIAAEKLGIGTTPRKKAACNA